MRYAVFKKLSAIPDINIILVIISAHTHYAEICQCCSLIVNFFNFFKVYLLVASSEYYFTLHLAMSHHFLYHDITLSD